MTGVFAAHAAVVAHHITGQLALDLKPNDLVHGRSGMGHGHLLRHHLAAHQWGDLGGRRGGRCGAPSYQIEGAAGEDGRGDS